MNTLSNNLSSSPIFSSSSNKFSFATLSNNTDANVNASSCYSMLSPFISGCESINIENFASSNADAMDNDDCQSISSEFNNINITGSATSDDTAVYDEDDDCITTHPYVKMLRNYQTQVFRPAASNDKPVAYTSNSCNNTTFHNDEYTNSTSAPLSNIKSEPFKDIISVIEKQVDYYKNQNDLMYNTNHVYFQYFCNNIAYATENQKKIKQLESLLDDVKGVGCQLKNIKNQSNYLNNKI